jgi:cytochrome oxidase Cu insertion factor (SCO1/SenC/PrrC family)
MNHAKSAVSVVSKPAGRAKSWTLPIWKSATRQVWKPAPRYYCGSFVTLIAMIMLAHSALSGEALNTTSNRPPCCAKEMVACAPLPDRSLYQLESWWTNDSGAGLRLTALRGRPQIMTMFFANCGYACPILVHDMKRIEAALPENARTNCRLSSRLL